MLPGMSGTTFPTHGVFTVCGDQCRGASWRMGLAESWLINSLPGHEGLLPLGGKGCLVETIRVLFFRHNQPKAGITRCPVSSRHVSPRPQSQEKWALHCLYKSTEGPGWLCSEGWDGVFDANLSSLYGVSTEAGRVTKISLGANNLDGGLLVFSLRYVVAGLRRALTICGSNPSREY